MPEKNIGTSEEFCRKIEKLLNASTGSVAGSQELSSLRNWDSLAILEFIVLADSDYKSDVQASDIAACKTVDDLAQLTFFHSGLSHASLPSGD